MAIETYKAFVDRMIQRYEGGYGWNKKDPGGPTKYGITCYDLAEHRGQKMASMTAWAPLVEAMPLSEAADIYRTKYATAIRYNDLPAGVDCCVMDYGVNSGCSRAILSLRAILGVKGNGLMDETLVAAIKKVDPVQLISSLCAERLQFMHGIRGGSAWAEFGGGWGSRVADLKLYSDHLAQGKTVVSAPAPTVDLANVVTPKAIHQPDTAPTATMASAATVAIAAHTAGAPLWGVAVAAIAVIAIGIIYEAWSESRATTANAAVAVKGA